MSRLIPCALCGLHKGCMARGQNQPLCAESPARISLPEIADALTGEIERKRKEIRDKIRQSSTPPKEKKMTQQYSTPDGSVWEVSTHGALSGMGFLRVASPDGQHDADFRPQSLDEVLKHWGPLSLHDPYADEHEALVKVLKAIAYHSDPVTCAQRIQRKFREDGVRLVAADDE